MEKGAEDLSKSVFAGRQPVVSLSGGGARGWRLFRGPEGIGEALADASDAEAAERLLDAYEMACLRPYRYDCFGAERLIGYLAAYEAEGRNLRVILAGRAAGADGEIIRERLCLGYV